MYQSFLNLVWPQKQQVLKHLTELVSNESHPRDSDKESVDSYAEDFLLSDDDYVFEHDDTEDFHDIKMSTDNMSDASDESLNLLT